jgi:hypothetical protein
MQQCILDALMLFAAVGLTLAGLIVARRGGITIVVVGEQGSQNHCRVIIVGLGRFSEWIQSHLS